MSWIEFIQTIILLWLLERSLWQRPRYRMALNWGKTNGRTPFIYCWILCQQENGGPYMRTGGRLLFMFGNRLIK